jgi:hypothetical protein
LLSSPGVAAGGTDMSAEDSESARQQASGRRNLGHGAITPIECGVLTAKHSAAETAAATIIVQTVAAPFW